MSQLLKRMIACVALALAVPVASANVLDFDDLSGGPAFFLQDYQGFRFGTNNLATTAWFYTDLTGPTYVPHSGTHYVATDFQLYSGGLNDPTQPISRATPFVFNGAYFSGGDPISYQLFLGNTLVYTSSSSAPLTGTSTFIASGYSGSVNSVVIVGHQGFYALDDFTYTNVVTAVVPEPETLPLLAAGLLCIGLTVRRRGAWSTEAGLRVTKRSHCL